MPIHDEIFGHLTYTQAQENRHLKLYTDFIITLDCFTNLSSMFVLTTGG